MSVMSGNVHIGNCEEYGPFCVYNKLIPGAQCDRGKKIEKSFWFALILKIKLFVNCPCLIYTCRAVEFWLIYLEQT